MTAFVLLQLTMTLVLAADRFIHDTTPDITLSFTVSSVNPENVTDMENNVAMHTFSFVGLTDVFLDQP